MTRALQGLWIPLITPFTPYIPFTTKRGNTEPVSIDLPALIRLRDRYGSLGISGFVANGTTGEPAALSAEEQTLVLETLLADPAKCGVIAGISGSSLAQASAQIRRLNDYPIDGVLVSAPSYVTPAQDGICAWFEHLAQLSRAPIVIYDIPYRTGVQISLDSMRRLARHPNIKAVKDCGNDWAKTQALIADHQLQMFAGEDQQLFAVAAAGGAGAIAASAHLFTAQFAEVLRLLQAGALSDARSLWQLLLPWVAAAFVHPNPAPVKARLAQLKLIENLLRLPMTAVSDAQSTELAAICERVTQALDTRSAHSTTGSIRRK